MERIDNDNAIETVNTETTSPAITDVREPKPAARKRTATKPAARGTVSAVPQKLADVIRLARTVNMANFADVIRPINAGSVVNAPGKNVGRFTSTRIVHFQNTLLINNATVKLTDVQLLFVMRAEFPSAVGRVFTADVATGVSIVRGIRAEFNRNGHGEPQRKPAGFVSVAYAPQTTRIP